MSFLTTVAAACAATMILAGAASAADLPQSTSGGHGVSSGYGAGVHRSGGYGHHGRYRHHSRHGGSLFGIGHRSSRAGRAQQRHRTRLDRCNNVPSRC